MAPMDLDFIMNTVQDFGKDFFPKNQNNVKLLAVLREQTKLILEYISTDKIKMQEDFNEKLKEKDTEINKLKSELLTSRYENDALGTYNRRENLKIVGVKYEEGENTNNIVKEVCKLAGREITDADISTSHRNGSIKTSGTNNLPGMANGSLRNPDIIVRFVRRDVKIAVFEGRKMWLQILIVQIS